MNLADQSWSRHQCTEPLGTPLFGLERLRKNCAEPAIIAHIPSPCNTQSQQFPSWPHYFCANIDCVLFIQQVLISKSIQMNRKELYLLN